RLLREASPAYWNVWEHPSGFGGTPQAAALSRTTPSGRTARSASAAPNRKPLASRTGSAIIGGLGWKPDSRDCPMPILFTCRQGHQWQPETNGQPATAQRIVCPECGAGAETFLPGEGAPVPTVDPRTRSYRPPASASGATADAKTLPPR